MHQTAFLPLVLGPMSAMADMVDMAELKKLVIMGLNCAMLAGTGLREFSMASYC